MDLLTVGEAFEDLVFAGLPRLPRLSEELRVDSLSLHPGGGALITAIAAARIGLQVGTISALSAANASTLRRQGISVVNLRRRDERGAVTVALSTRRDRAFVTYEGVNRSLEPRLLAALRRLRRGPRHVHFALVPRKCRSWLPVVDRLRTRGVTTSWDFGWHGELVDDPALQRLLAALDWVFVNEREATFYAGARTMRGAKKHWRDHVRGTVIKLGARGAVILRGDREIKQDTRHAEVVDTTGAGDSFNAGFLAAILARASLLDAARLGNYIGGRNVQAAGGIDGLPHHGQLPRWAQRILEAA